MRGVTPVEIDKLSIETQGEDSDIGSYFQDEANTNIDTCYPI